MAEKKQFQLKELMVLIDDFKPSLCIFNTFILDKKVVEKISERIPGDARIIAFFDPKSGLKSAEVLYQENIQFFSENYLPIPVTAKNGIFHSKLIVMIKKQDKSLKAMVITGSFNLSKKSFSEDGIESAVCVELDTSKDDENVILRSIAHYLIKINEENQIFDLSYKKEINEYLNDIYVDSSVNTTLGKAYEFVTNGLGNSTAEVMRNVLRELGNNCTAWIASPFIDYSEKLDNYIKECNFSSISLFSRRTKKSIEAANRYNVEYFVPANSGKQRQPEMFHSKNYLFYNNTNYCAYVGSSNFTNPGFYYGDRNIECGFVIRGERGDKVFSAIESWFKTGWKVYDASMQPVKETEPEDDDYNGDDIFLLAELIETNRKKIVRVHYEKTDNVELDIPTRLYRKQKNGESHIDCEYQNKDTIEVIVNGKKKILPITNSKQFLQGYNSSSAGIPVFATSGLKEESTDYEELEKHIKSNGISIGDINSNIKEPPILEQYYQNLKHEFSYLHRRKYFTKREICLFKQRIVKTKGGPGTFELIKMFELFNSEVLDKLNKQELNKMIFDKVEFEGVVSKEDFLKLIKFRKLDS